jgi:hypothetical protein
MKHREANKTTILNKALKTLGIYGYIEYKQTRANTFNLSHFEPHQIPSLEACQQSGLVWKLSDADPRQKPCDTLSLPPGMTSWIGIIFDDCCCFVYLDRILNFKSITKDKAKELATYVVKL